MTDRKLLRTGAAGSVIAAICCFTPALVILLGAVDLSAWLADPERIDDALEPLEVQPLLQVLTADADHLVYQPPAPGTLQ